MQHPSPSASTATGGKDLMLRANSNESGHSWNTASDVELSPSHSPPATQTQPSSAGPASSGDNTLPLKRAESAEAEYFAMGDFDVGEEEVEIGGEDTVDEKALTKRDIHTLNEQRRRDIIKHGYSTITELVPTCKPTASGGKLSRAALLQKTLDYIVFLQSQSARQQQQLMELRKEVKALRIMKENYEQISRTHQSTPTTEAPQVPDHVKFLVFERISNQLFQSFNSSISVTSFDTLSSCIISWLEEYCKPQTLRELVISSLQEATRSQVLTQQHHPPPSNH